MCKSQSLSQILTVNKSIWILKHITIFVLPKIKLLDINLRKYLQGLYEENYKILIKETKELNKWWDVPCSWIGRLNTVKISVFPTQSFRFNTVSIELLANHVVAINKLTTFIWIGKKI